MPAYEDIADDRKLARKSFLGGIIWFCIHNKLVVTLLVLAIMTWGVMVAPFDWKVGDLPRSPVPVDAIPDIGENQQIVFTEWMGRSPEDVEDQIGYPLTVALLGIPEVKTIRSYSMFGFSSIYIIFNESAEFYWSRSRVLEKLNSLPAGTLPEGVQPALGPDATALGQILWYTLEGHDPDGNPTGGWDLDELRTIQDWYVRYSLTSAEGVSEVASIGGFVQEYQIDVDPDAMRAAKVSLADVFQAVRMTNVDVGARTIELNKVEYVIRGLGFIENVEDIEKTVLKVSDNVPITIKDVATVRLGPGLRRGALDKAGAEAVGGVVTVRYGFNPLESIKNVKQKITEISPGLPTKVVVDYTRTTKQQVDAYAETHNLGMISGADPDFDPWVQHLRGQSRDQWPAWITTSQVRVVPFYDRTGVIYETLGTLNTALSEEILVTIIVILVMVLHLRSSILISALLPLAVLMCFIAMKTFGVDANIVALSGIAIAIGTMVNMGIIVCENILKHLDEASEESGREGAMESDENSPGLPLSHSPTLSSAEVIFRASHEVAGAVVTAVSTTVVSFLPVFTMIAAEGKLFRPLAFTKTFALVAAVIVALTIIPPAAHVLMGGRVSKKGSDPNREASFGPFRLLGSDPFFVFATDHDAVADRRWRARNVHDLVVDRPDPGRPRHLQALGKSHSGRMAEVRAVHRERYRSACRRIPADRALAPAGTGKRHAPKPIVRRCADRRTARFLYDLSAIPLRTSAEVVPESQTAVPIPTRGVAVVRCLRVAWFRQSVFVSSYSSVSRRC